MSALRFAAIGFLAVAACLPLDSATAQSDNAAAAPKYESLVGHWTGTVNTQQGPMSVMLSFDSSAAGLHGASLAPDQSPTPMDFSSISIKADTINLGLDAGGTDVAFNGWINPANHQFEGELYFGGADAGSFAFKRVPDAPAKTDSTSARHPR